MHRGYVGSPGHRKGCGKTAAAVRQVIERHKALNRKIITNIWLGVPHFAVSPDMLISLSKDPKNFENTIVFLDEIQNIFNSIGKGTANLVFNFIQNQSRKGSTDLVWTSQRAKNVDNRILDDASIWVCTKHHRDGKKCADDEDVCTEPHYIKVQNIHSGKKYAFEMGPSLGSLYNTNEIVPLAFFQHNQLRKILAGQDPGAAAKISLPVPTKGMNGQDLEEKFVEYLRKILGKKAIIRHNNNYRDGWVSLFDVEVEFKKTLYLFDVCGTTTQKGRSPRLNTDLKNFGDKIELASARGADPYLAFQLDQVWRGLKIYRGADWIDLKGKVTMGKKRAEGARCVRELF